MTDRTSSFSSAVAPSAARTPAISQSSQCHWTDVLRGGVAKTAVLGWRQWRTRLIERWLRISTPYPNVDQFDLNTHFNDAIPNEPVDYLLLRRFMQHVPTTPDDVVFDIGCGMGRTLCMFARRAVRQCVGIEFDPRLVEIARRNAQRVRGRRSDVIVRCGDAVDADYSGGTVYWLFNPFGASTLKVVLYRIVATLRTEPRAIQIAYINPMHETTLAASGWLQCVRRFHSPWFRTYGASFWRYEPNQKCTAKANAAFGRMDSVIAELDTHRTHPHTVS